jgi:1-acyl-sn-glycerol-3-phosphate acyltransferase
VKYPVYWIGWTVSWLFSHSYLWLRARGRRNVPARGAVVLVANHQSVLDPAVIGCSTGRRLRFVMRATLDSSRFMRWFAPRVHVIAIDRDTPTRATFTAIEAALAAGDAVVLFAEGTRSRDGRIQPFKRGLQAVLARQPVPVVPVGLRGTFRALPAGRHWPRPAAVHVAFGAPLPAADVLADHGLERLRARVAELAGLEPAGESELGRPGAGEPNPPAPGGDAGAPMSGPDARECRASPVPQPRRSAAPEQAIPFRSASSSLSPFSC